MRPYFLSTRDGKSREIMEDPGCDRSRLWRTYRQFGSVNRFTSGWARIYHNWLRPAFVPNRLNTLLDVGFGGGDIPVRLARWARRDGFELQVTAIDTDPRSLEFVTTLKTPRSVDFQQVSISELVSQRKSFDFVISNNLLHHLDAEGLSPLLADARRLSTRMVLVDDIERSDTAALLFILFSRLFYHRSFVSRDGLTSIRRSYTFQELKRAGPPGWQVRRAVPFRVLLIYRHDA